MEEKDKKLVTKKSFYIYIGIIITLIILLFFLSQSVYKNLVGRRNYENSVVSFSQKNMEKIFSINKIVFFSNSDSKNKSSSLTNFTIQNLYTYTDIAIFIDNNSEENIPKNTLKNLKITNIEFDKKPIVGEPQLYYKSINDFAKSEFEEKNLIQNNLEFQITSQDEIDLSVPVLYNNCANPITLSYINQNIKTDYTMTDTQNPITYNGTLLKRCGVLISSIEADISFNIEIENNENQKFRTTVHFKVPYEKDEKSIYDGNLIIKEDTSFDFYRYE